jgi:uncharacterized protein YgiM (DUF1202 family)
MISLVLWLTLGLSLLLLAILLAPLVILGYVSYRLLKGTTPEAKAGGVATLALLIALISYGAIWIINNSKPANAGRNAPASVESAYVNTPQLNLRSGPGSEYSVITKLSQGGSVICFGTTQSRDGGVWVKVRAGSFEGWANQKLLSKDDPSQQALPSGSTVSPGNPPSDTSQDPALMHRPTCAKEASIRSIEGGINTSFTIINRAKSTLIIYWLDYQGERQEYFKLEPDETREQDTYKNHPWLVADTAGNCLRIFYAPAEIIITTHSSRADESYGTEMSGFRLDGVWNGEWSDASGNVFTCETKLDTGSDNTIDGSILWTLKKTSRPDLQSKIGLKAVEYVRGIYDAKSSVVNFEGYEKDDPHQIIDVDKYRLHLTKDNNSLSGQTYSLGTWEGKFSAVRKK